MEEQVYQVILRGLSEKCSSRIHTKWRNYEIRNGQVFRIKESKRLRVIRRFELEMIMAIFHDHPTGAHFSTRKMYEKIKARYFWPNMLRDIETYVKTCDRC